MDFACFLANIFGGGENSHHRYLLAPRGEGIQQSAWRRNEKGKILRYTGDTHTAAVGYFFSYYGGRHATSTASVRNLWVHVVSSRGVPPPCMYWKTPAWAIMAPLSMQYLSIIRKKASVFFFFFFPAAAAGAAAAGRGQAQTNSVQQRQTDRDRQAGVLHRRLFLGYYHHTPSSDTQQTKSVSQSSNINQPWFLGNKRWWQHIYISPPWNQKLVFIIIRQGWNKQRIETQQKIKIHITPTAVSISCTYICTRNAWQ